MAEQENFMPVLEEDAPIVLATGNYCAFCGEPVDKDDPGVYRKVESWVHGPKQDSPVLRQQTGWYAHPECIEKAINGQSPDQEPIF